MSRVLLCSESTYLVATGGVDTWCQMLVSGLPEIDYGALVVTPGGRRDLNRRSPSDVDVFVLPSTAAGVAQELQAAGFGTERRAPSRREIDHDLLPHIERLLTDALAPEEPQPDTAPIENLWTLFQCLDSDLCFSSPRLRRRVQAIVDAHLKVDSDEQKTAETIGALRYFLGPLRTPHLDADVVHSVTTGPVALYAIVHKRRRGTPLLLTEHGVRLREVLLEAVRRPDSQAARLHRRLQRWCARAAYREADLIATTSSFNRRWEIRLGADPATIRVVPNGIELEKFPTQTPRRGGRPTVLSVGRVSPIKDTLTLIEAAAIVRRSVPRVRFMIFGSLDEDPVYVYRCRRSIRELGLRRSVTLVGARRRGPGLYASGDVLAQTSVSESQPLSVIEAMASGLPVVATDVGGVAEVVGEAATLIPPRQPEALAVALLELLRDSRLRADLGERARRRANELSHTRVLDHYRNLYRELGG
jgi:glycosyltransferase involved in cell wall biosynthesis